MLSLHTTLNAAQLTIIVQHSLHSLSRCLKQLGTSKSSKDLSENKGAVAKVILLSFTLS